MATLFQKRRFLLQLPLLTIFLFSLSSLSPGFLFFFSFFFYRCDSFVKVTLSLLAKGTVALYVDSLLLLRRAFTTAGAAPNPFLFKASWPSLRRLCRVYENIDKILRRKKRELELLLRKRESLCECVVVLQHTHFLFFFNSSFFFANER